MCCSVHRYSLALYTSQVISNLDDGRESSLNVFVTVFGERGDTGRRHLTHSKTHAVPFRSGQIDVFFVSAVHLGQLKRIVVELEASRDVKGYSSIDSFVVVHCCRHVLSELTNSVVVYSFGEKLFPISHMRNCRIVLLIPNPVEDAFLLLPFVSPHHSTLPHLAYYISISHFTAVMWFIRGLQKLLVNYQRLYATHLLRELSQLVDVIN